MREPFWATGAPPFRHGYTYSGHAAACAVALANLDIIEREGLLDRVREAEPVLAEALAPVAELPGVAEVRHAGLLGAIELEPGCRRRDAAVLAARERGVLTRALRGTALQFSPAFIATDDELRAMVAGLAEAVDAVVTPRRRSESRRCTS